MPHPVVDQADDGVQPVTPPALPLETTPGHLIRRAQQVHTALWSAELGGDLTGPQYALLSALSGGVDLDQRTAGRMASLDKSTAADVVARLERGGWVRRDRDPADGRRNTLALTPAARVALVDVTVRVRNVQERLLDPLEPGGRERFVDLLGRVAYAGPPGRDQRNDPAVVLPLSTTPGHLVRRAEQVHGVLWGTHVGDRVTPPQYALLCTLALRPGLDQSAAGELASLDKSSAADVVARLVRRGWVTSTRDPADRRRKLLALTPATREVLGEVTPAVRTVQREFLRPLTAADRDELTRLLHQVAYPSRPAGG